ncbi:MAG: flavin reductase [Chloroflexi bacterium]|nr:flavin reductase [Chloroflexota bacterium]
MTEGAAKDPRLFRDVLGRFATGVTVLTVNVDGELRGMTANAVSSLSLQPMLMLVCIDRNASAHPLWERAEGFGVSILDASQRHLSELFARHGPPDEPMGGAPYRTGPFGVPLLEGALGHASCRIVSRLPGGDHTIVVGEVEEMGIDRPDGSPLIFFSGAYYQLDGRL